MSEKSDNFINIEKIRKSLHDKDERILEINIEYPQAEASDIPIINEKINGFYKKVAENYVDYCESKLRKRIIVSRNGNKDFRPYGEIMKCIITYSDSDYLSILFEITHFNGYFKRTSRMNHTWSLKKGIILPVGYFLKKMNKGEKQLRGEIGKKIFESVSGKETDFSYSEKSIAAYAMKADLSHFFLCRNGIAFWFDPGTLAPENEGFPAFVIPFSVKQNELS